MEQIIAGAIASAIVAGATVIIAGTGELIAQRTGVINVGIDGMMTLGALVAIISVNNVVSNAWFALVIAMAAGMVAGIIFAVVSVSLKAEQVIAGFGITFLANGLCGHIGRSYVGTPASNRFMPIEIPVLSDLPFFGKALFSHNVLVYLAYLVLPFLAYYLLYMTRHGLNIRAVGQEPSAADAHGVRVDRLRFFYCCINGALDAAAGAYLVLAVTPSWSDGVVAGRGWIALALVIFARWNPLVLVLGGFLFGAATSIGFIAQVQGWGISTSILFMLPYLLTLFITVASFYLRKRRGFEKVSDTPAALAKPFYRE